MTEERLKEIEERASKATKGPWFKEVDGDQPWFWVTGTDKSADAIASYTEPADAEFIVHARTDVPELIAYVRKLQEKNAKLREMLKSLEWDHCDGYEVCLVCGQEGPDGLVHKPDCELARLLEC